MTILPTYFSTELIFGALPMIAILILNGGNGHNTTMHFVHQSNFQ